jgi:nanoRNase/pAp phosphatase (c-di-AMP/oligoRNAs hydrolase)
LGKTPDNSLVYCDSESISNCILLYEIVRDCWKELLDENIATYFFMGLATDS